MYTVVQKYKSLMYQNKNITSTFTKSKAIKQYKRK